MEEAIAAEVEMNEADFMTTTTTTDAADDAVEMIPEMKEAAEVIPAVEVERIKAEDDEENPIDLETGMRTQSATIHEVHVEGQMLETYLTPLMPKSNELYPNNDKGNARRFLELEGARVRFCPEKKQWYVFDGIKWVPEEETRIRKMAQDALEHSNSWSSRGITGSWRHWNRKS